MTKLRIAYATTLLLLMLPSVVQAQFTFTTNSDGSLNIYRYIGPGGAVVIPSSTNGLPVTSIGEGAFSHCYSLTNITIGTNVTSIGEGAFYDCVSLTNVTIPNSVITMRDTFQFCTSLANVTIGNSVTSIVSMTFYHCTSLTNVTIPNSVTNIGDEAFYSCTNLASVYCQGNAPGLGSDVFYDDANAIVYYLPGTTGWGSTFGGLPTVNQGLLYTTNNGTITIMHYTGSSGAVVIPSTINGLPVTSIGNGAFENCPSPTNVTIGTNVTSIGGLAFLGCIRLTSVTIPNSVTSIGENAFGGCTSLTNVAIPNSVTNIGLNPFVKCLSLTTITVDTNNPAYSSVNGVLFDKSQTTLIEYPGGKGGSYTIPNSVTSIVSMTFYHCTSLTNVTIPNSVISIGSGAFNVCASLTNVTIGNSVTSIGNGAFAECTSLSSVTIPNSVTNIGGSAFDNCHSLTSVYSQGNAPSLGLAVFNQDNNATVYYMPGTTGWPTFNANSGLNPAVLWNPQAQTSDGSFGVQNNQFGFNITGTSNIVVVVEACTNLANPSWSPVGTNTLTGGSSYFSDPQWTNYPIRFYRLRSP
jgi:hypothetical protein